MNAGQQRTFEARLSIDEKPGSKAFQGVWLHTDDGRLLVAYRSSPYWQAFEGRRVTVTGEDYQPRGQAIGAAHFRVEHLRVADLDFQNATKADMEMAIIELWAERTYRGRFVVEVIPPGSKLSGTSFTWFISEGGERFLKYDQQRSVPLDKPVVIRARQVEPTPFIARLGGPYLWIVDIDESAGPIRRPD